MDEPPASCLASAADLSRRRWSVGPVMNTAARHGQIVGGRKCGSTRHSRWQVRRTDGYRSRLRRTTEPALGDAFCRAQQDNAIAGPRAVPISAAGAAARSSVNTSHLHSETTPSIGVTGHRPLRSRYRHIC